MKTSLASAIRHRFIRSVRPLTRAVRYSFYLYDKRHSRISEWSRHSLRYIGIADGRTDPRVEIMERLLESAISLSGDIAECGVFQGHTSVVLGLAIKERSLTKKVYALDSFEGFDETAEREAASLAVGIENVLLRKGAFAETSIELIQWKLRETGLEDIVMPIKGYFQDTLPTLSDNEYCFVHLDCDLAESYRECLAYFYPRVVPGGCILFDEYRISAWPLTTQAIDEFFSDKPEKPFEIVSRVKAGASRWAVRKAAII